MSHIESPCDSLSPCHERQRQPWLYLSILLQLRCRRQRENQFAEDNSTSACLDTEPALPSAKGQALPDSDIAEPSLTSGQTTATEQGTEGLQTHADHLSVDMDSDMGPEVGTTEVGDTEMAPETGPREAQTEEEVREQIQARLPGTEWKARLGTAGTAMEQQRVSPIVELSMLLVSLCCLRLLVFSLPLFCL